jgi:hypothetical protein
VRISHFKELRGQLWKPFRFNDSDLAHVFFGSQDKFMVDDPY